MTETYSKNHAHYQKKLKRKVKNWLTSEERKSDIIYFAVQFLLYLRGYCWSWKKLCILHVYTVFVGVSVAIHILLWTEDNIVDNI